ncbi:uncharacterized protein SCHCODRAFT_02345212 [Schizophyllum commune H4-8]|uniref:uncharacterized protein n=1 Tax=Schizophyllum commune (strain H4-8 / FGSC 9210) TaxID=578458 RepID=UPI00215E9C7C|nr:uncharacterized protein SCHCODRAFT_02345212 [Schizophyllum commune H4-8]KAI5890444.1 hypothetical protein SCHCODRAFT_02345212 [Schizophyllum commune H4-8]
MYMYFSIVNSPCCIYAISISCSLPDRKHISLSLPPHVSSFLYIVYLQFSVVVCSTFFGPFLANSRSVL